MPTSDGGIHGGRVRGIGSLFGNCRLNHTLLLLWNHLQPRRPNSDRPCKRVRTPSMLTLVRYIEGVDVWGSCDFWVASNKLISGRQMTGDYSCCNAAWESLASLASLVSLASLGWDHLLHGNHLRSRPLHSDGLRRDVRLRGDLGGSDFWRVRCSKIQIVWGWLLLLFRPRGRLADIYDDATAPNAIPLVLELLVIVYFVSIRMRPMPLAKPLRIKQ